MEVTTEIVIGGIILIALFIGLLVKCARWDND